jgi:hypothetical protein
LKKEKANICLFKAGIRKEKKMIMVLTNILLIIIIVFIIGNLILAFLLRRSALRYMPIGNFAPSDTRFEVMESKLDLLNKRVAKIEHELRYKKKR